MQKLTGKRRGIKIKRRIIEVLDFEECVCPQDRAAGEFVDGMLVIQQKDAKRLAFCREHASELHRRLATLEQQIVQNANNYR